MGIHAEWEDDPQLQDGAGEWTSATFIYGFLDGTIAFQVRYVVSFKDRKCRHSICSHLRFLLQEPMVTRALLESKETFRRDVIQPQVYARDG